MGLVRGTLWDLCNPRSEHGPHYVPPSLPDRLRLVSEAALGLQFLHAAGIAHRDCHPKNVLVTTLTGHTAAAVVADLSRSCRLPRAGAVQLDVLAIVQMLLTLVIGVTFSDVARVFDNAQKAARNGTLEGSVQHAWALHRALLRRFLGESIRARVAWVPLRSQAALAAATVMMKGGGDLTELREALATPPTSPSLFIPVISPSSVLQLLEDSSASSRAPPSGHALKLQAAAQLQTAENQKRKRDSMDQR
jgi:hypothetical protein